MKLKSEKVYKCITRQTQDLNPTLCVRGVDADGNTANSPATAEVYVSLSTTCPEGIEQMIDVSEELGTGFNTLEGQIRYICVKFGAGVEVTECGIVTDTFSYREEDNRY